jgi:hypothetical protein
VSRAVVLETIVVVGKAGADLPERIAQGKDFRVFRLPLPETR